MKRNTKAFFTTLLLTCSAFLSIFYVSCNHGNNSPFLDKCAAISCAYGGHCDNGKCICPTGYDGTNCEIITREKFLGSWNVKEKGTITVDREYAVAIERDEAVNYVLIKNMYNYFATAVRASVVKDTLYIANQQLNGKIVFGKGYIYTDSLGTPNGKLSLRYEIVDSANNNIVDDFGYYEVLDNSKPSSWSKQP